MTVRARRHASAGVTSLAERPELTEDAVLAIAAERVARLSDGQREVLQLVDNHLNSKEIAAQLGISPHTVDQRLRGAIRILGVTKRQEAARLFVQVAGSSQRLIHQPSDIDLSTDPAEPDGAISSQIRHADRAGGVGPAGFHTEQGTAGSRPLLVWPFATRNHPRNEMSVGQRLLWIVLIAMGASFSAGMYLAGLESLARLVRS
ncbi:helix-turn-helix transcriptional regulator [Sphingomonas sp. GCM10030256]|uniref:helix-turn-helix domain-containing protein n=1 Tax=Sphingomonas sp. GCM10030256 TaxID=3273427 RepID=UPI0036204CBF